ncbi:MAG: Ser/Thr protein phosphatase family protein [Myxococcaceae bacterium]|nr:Ser/Thr protein phosphatase family protein [Myxococcaceae bacterium]
MSRTIVIGDLHGCYDEAVALLRALHVGPSDRLIFAGDLVDRGPRPRECVELAMQHECIMGNHEERHLNVRRFPGLLLSADHLATRNALEDRHYDYLAKLPLLLRLPELGAAVVHAGAFPGVALEQQKPRHLLHIQNIKPPGTRSYWPSKAPADYRFWASFWEGPERLIFGHSVLSAPLVTERAVGIDTGAVFGRGLTAVILPEWRLFTLPTPDYTGGRHKRTGRYPIHGEVTAYS